MGKFKTNKVKCDIGSYIHYWRGVKKSGKTTLFYNLLQEQYGDLNKGLLISIGNEIGYQALDGLVYAEAPTWDDLIEINDELVENKEDNEFEMIGLDTADEWIKLAKEEVKRIHKKKKGVAAEFGACLGGYGQPRDKVVELIDNELARLRNAGYGIVVIGHTKIKDIKEKNGDAYQQLTSNLNADYDGIFANKADIVMTISVEKQIDEEKHINGTDRYMYFRSDGFVDAGGRFADMPERVEYGASNYIEAFEMGVRGAVKEGTDIEKEKKKEIKERKEKGAKFSKAMKENKIDVDKNLELIAQLKEKFDELDKDKKREFKALMSEKNVKSLKDEVADEISTKVLEELLSHC